MKQELIEIRNHMSQALEICQEGDPNKALYDLNDGLDKIEELIKEAKCDIEAIVCKELNITKAQLHSKLSNRKFVEARQIIMWYELTSEKKTQEVAASRFNLNHSTAHYAKNTIENLIETNAVFRKK